MQYSIIIIGGGSAGMVCAIRAAMRGSKVLVIDKANEIGGTLHLTAGHLSAAGTQLQAAKGIHDTAQDHYNDVDSISQHTMQPALTHKAVTLAAATVDWLVALGYPMHPNAPIIIHGHQAYSTARTYMGSHDYAAKDITTSAKTVYYTLLPLWHKYVASGHITVLLKHSLQGLVTNGLAITHINALNLTTNAVTVIPVHTAQVVVTTGGYAANATLYTAAMQPYALDATKHYPARLLSSASEYSQGDGILAITAIGGTFDGAQHHLSTLGGIELEPGSGRASFWHAWARVTNSHDRVPREIYINAMGNRFMNEHDLTVDERERIVLQQPNQRFYVLCDHKALYSGPPIVVQWTADEFVQQCEQEKCCWKADTIAALAAKINVPAANLLHTVTQYNSYVYNQKDLDYNRTVLTHTLEQGPYYALLVYAYSLISFGGVVVNDNLQVLHSSGAAFTNLYAAGEVLGAAATSGNAFCGGMLLTPALSFGMWLGDYL